MINRLIINSLNVCVWHIEGYHLICIIWNAAVVIICVMFSVVCTGNQKYQLVYGISHHYNTV